MLRIDDIPQQVADDIHAFGVIGALFADANMFTNKQISFHIEQSRRRREIFHNFRRKIISHSPQVNISLNKIPTP